MEGIIRNYLPVKLICHLLLTVLWIYWGIRIYHQDFGWISWGIFVVGGIVYLFFGVGFLSCDDDMDFNGSDGNPFWALGYGLINLIPLSWMLNFTLGFYPSEPSSLIYPAAYIALTLILYGFNGFGSACLLTYLILSLWIINWGFNRWYDYCIFIISALVGVLSIIIVTFKSDDESKSEVWFWIINFGLTTLLNASLISLLYFNSLLDFSNPYNIIYLTISAILFLLVISTRLITSIITFVAIAIYWYEYSDFTVGSLIHNTSFDWIHSDWTISMTYIIGGICGLGLLVYLIYRLLPTKVEYVERFVERDHK